MFCSQPSLDSWAWTGLPEGFGRWKYQPQERQARELFFISFLTEKLAVMCWVSFCLLPGTFEPAAPLPAPNGACRARKNQVYRQEKLPLLLLSPLPTRWERQDLPTTTAPDIGESTPKHHTAALAPQILLLGEHPDKPIPVPEEEDVCLQITAPKPRIRGCHKVASPRLENSWISPESATKGIKPFELPRTILELPQTLLC